MMAGLESAMQSGSDLQADKQNGQMNFFGQMAQKDQAKDSHGLPDVAPWPEQEMLVFEKEVLGFYVTSNPLSHYADVIDMYSTKNTSQLGDIGVDNQVVIGGMITRIRYNLTKTGKNAGSKMAVFVLEDLQSEVEVVLFPNTLKKYADIVLADTVVFVRGNIDDRRGKPNILAEEIIVHDDDLALKLVDKVRITFHSRDVSPQKVAMVKNLCGKYKGSHAVDLAIRTGKGSVLATADTSLSVWPSPEFCQDMVHLVGRKNFRLIFRRSKPRKSWGRNLTKQAVTG
jgi:DNA polymerase-3 subunit alpha